MNDVTVLPSRNAVPMDQSLDALIAQLEAGWQTAETSSETSVAAIAVADDPADAPAPERRHARRLKPEEFPGGLRLTIVGVAESSIVNVSQTGALAETPQRLCPGRTVDVSVRLNGSRRVVRAVVIRCNVHAVAPRPLFRAALRFSEHLTEAE